MDSQSILSSLIIKKGYIIVVKGDDSWFSRQVYKEQREKGFSKEDSKYTHVVVGGAGNSVVEVKPLLLEVVDFFENYKGRYIKIMRYRSNEPDLIRLDKEANIAFWASSHSNLPYDIIGILAFKFEWLFKHQKRFYFCSENALWSIQKEYPTALKALPPDETLPAHILIDEYFECVWEGVV